MFASGFIYKRFSPVIHTGKQYASFIKNKVHRLVVPYLSVSLILITVKIIASHYLEVDNPCTPYSFIEMLYMPAAGYFLWFIYVLFLIFLIVPFFSTRKSRIILWGISLVMYLLPIDFPAVFCLNQFKTYLLFFMSGVIFAESYDIDKHYMWSRWIIIPLLLLCINIIITTYVDYTDNSYISIILIKLFLAFNGILSILWISRYCCKYRQKLLLVIASSSFIIYLLHTTFESFCRTVLFYTIPGLSNKFFILSACIIVLAGIIIPILIDRNIIRKYTITRYLFGLK